MEGVAEGRGGVAGGSKGEPGMETSEALREPPGDRKPAGEVTLGAASDSEVAPAVPPPAPQESAEPYALPRAPALAMPDDTDEEVLDRRMRRALRTLFELSEQFDDPQIEFQLSGALKDFYGFQWGGPGEVVDVTGAPYLEGARAPP